MEKSFDVAAEIGPGILQSSLQVGAVTGSIGVIYGAVAGLLRGVNPLLFAGVSGLQCFSLGASYWIAKTGQFAYQASNGEKISSHDRVKASAIAGGISGATVASIFRGRRNIIPGAIVFSVFGYLGQSLYNKAQKRHIDQDPNAKHLNMLQRMANSPYTPVKLLTDEDYENLLREKLIRVEAEIAMVDEDIKRLQEEESAFKNGKDS